MHFPPLLDALLESGGYDDWFDPCETCSSPNAPACLAGATRTDITRMGLREAFGMNSAGLVIGALLAYWGKRFVASLIPGLPVQSVVPIVFGAAVMAALALPAAYRPARRAARVSAIEALRYE